MSEKNNPAYVPVTLDDDKIGIQGPTGFVAGQYERNAADILVSHMNTAFDAGRKFEQRKQAAESVPGPPDVPRPIHPTEVA